LAIAKEVESARISNADVEATHGTPATFVTGHHYQSLTAFPIGCNGKPYGIGGNGCQHDAIAFSSVSYNDSVFDIDGCG
jgi:hypothetical protein